MDRNGTWGTDIELITASHMLNSMYDTVSGTWTTYGPHSVDRSLNTNVTEMAMYIRHPHDHFDVHGRRSRSGWSGFGRTTFLPH